MSKFKQFTHRTVHDFAKSTKNVLLVGSLFLLIGRINCIENKSKEDTISNKKWTYVSFFIGSFLPWIVAFRGPDIIAGIDKYKPASVPLLDHIKSILGTKSFESVYVGTMHYFNAYVPNYKTLILRSRYDEKPHLLSSSVLEHEYAHSIRYSSEKIRFACFIVPLITYFGAQFLFKKLMNSKYSTVRAVCKRIDGWNQWSKGLLFGLTLFLLNQHLLAAFARYEEFMTDRTADVLFNKMILHKECYSNGPQSFFDILMTILLPAFFWNHPIRKDPVTLLNSF